MKTEKAIRDNVRVGKALAYKGYTLRVSPTIDGCKKCFFESEAGARYCKHRSSCFADQRPDKTSVKFVEVK